MWLVRLSLVLLLLSLGWTVSASAQACLIAGQGFAAVSYQEVTVNATTAVGMNLAQLPASATNLGQALVTVEDATIRFTFSGTPTATSGHELAPGLHFFICGRALMESFRAIRTSQGTQDAHMRISIFQPQ